MGAEPDEGIREAITAWESEGLGWVDGMGQTNWGDAWNAVRVAAGLSEVVIPDDVVALRPDDPARVRGTAEGVETARGGVPESLTDQPRATAGEKSDDGGEGDEATRDG